MISGILLILLVFGLYVYHMHQDQTPQTLFRRAEKLVDKGAYRRAVSQLRSIYEHYPNTDKAPQALLLAGDILLLNLQKEQEALLSFLLVERDYPDTSWGQAARQRGAAIYKYRLQDYGRALVAYQKILDSKSPDSEQTQYEIADTYFRMNNFEQTRIEFESLLNDYPDTKLFPEALYRIGSVFFLEGKFSDAMIVLQKLCHDYPDNAFALEGYFALAQIHEERGELSKALQVLKGLEGRYAKESVLEQRIAQIMQRIKKKNRAI
ncbi:MAG: tol-pal system YbgF family protein [Pedobacter sp.]